MGLPRFLRLKQSDDFARVRREGRTFRHKLLLMGVCPNDVGHNRYGIVTGKKVGKAFQRNRVRRVLRELVRHQHPHLEGGYDVVLVASPATADAPFAALQQAADALFRQAGLVRS